jgi:hypothetical protein
MFVLAIDPLAQILENATTLGVIHKIRGRGSILQASIYVDDGAVFVAPIKEDIITLANILESFGEVTGLCTKFQKNPSSLLDVERLTSMTFLQEY